MDKQNYFLTPLFFVSNSQIRLYSFLFVHTQASFALQCLRAPSDISWCFDVLQGLLEAVQFRRRNWHFFDLKTPMSLCFHLSLCQCASGEIEGLCWHASLSLFFTHTNTYTSTFSPFQHITLVLPFPLSPFFSSVCLRGIWGQSSRCRISSHPVWQNHKHHTGSDLLD